MGGMFVSWRRALLASAQVLVSIGCVSGPPARHVMPADHSRGTSGVDPAVVVYQSATDKSITEGETLLDAAPDVAYAAVLDYTRWPAIFPNIRTVVITQHGADEARVTFIRTTDHRDNVHFRNRPAVRTIWFEDTGGRTEVWAEIVFAGGPTPGTTRVHSRLFAQIGGLAGWFVSDNQIRKMREQRVYDDLYDLHAFFAHH